MASIVGGIATSHTPSIGFAVDTHQDDDPVWGPIFRDYEPVRAWLENKAPDVLFLVYNDHVTSFSFDHYSHFALGIGDTHPVADEGGGARALPPLRGHPGLACQIAKCLVADEFDLSFFQGKGLDHGCFSPLSLIWPHDENGWPGAVVPLQVGVLQFPIPSARRCYKLGQSLRRAIQSYEDDLRVAVVATGGLSHQVNGERTGFNNTDWDMEFLDLLENDPEKLAELRIADYAKDAGLEGAEVIMWLIMRGAMSPRVRKLHQAYHLPSMTPIATVVYEDDASSDEPSESVEQFRARAARELYGIDCLEGTYPFTLERSVEAYRLNDFLHRLIEPGHRARFLDNPETSFDEAGLNEAEREMLRSRDWGGLIRYGASYFLLEKLAAAVGANNQEIYAGMRGESLEDFQKTRNAAQLYSVAKTDEDQRE